MRRKTNEKNYSLDLLKIIAIFFVIMLHYNYGTMGGLISHTTKWTFNYHYACFTESLAIIACNVFVIISGYFLCTNNKIKVRKIIDIILLLLFYGVVIYIISIIAGLTTFNMDTFKKMLFTINNRWFINVYILLYLLHPFINKVINNINKKQFLGLILICLFFISIWSSIMFPEGILNLNSFVSDGGYGITNFILLYLIGAYIRNYCDKLEVDKTLLLVIYIGLSLINTVLYYANPRVWSYNFIINIVNSIVLFMLFKQLNIKKGQLISKIASCSLAIYIIHENLFIRKYIYVNIFKSSLFYNSIWVIPHQILTCLGILLICLIIELIRKYLFKITISKVLDKNKHLNKIIEI